MALKGKKRFKGLPSSKEVEQAIDQTIERMEKVAVKAFQTEIRKSSWNKTPQRLLDSIKATTTNRKLSVTSDHPAAKYLEDDVKPHDMIYLTKASRPIPIITDNGKVIFRTASSKSLKDGSWRHPGITGKHFMVRGREKAMLAVKEEVRKTYFEILRGMVNGGES